MNITSSVARSVEKVLTRLRHAPALEKADWLWDKVRPAYERAIRLSEVPILAEY